MERKESKFRRILIALIGVIACICAGYCLIACGEKEAPPASVDESSILYDGNKISWDAPKGADAYKIVINDGAERTTKSTSYTYGKNSLGNATTLKVEISATNAYGESGITVREFTKLDDVTGITFSESGEMSWTSVEGASGYEVKVNGKTTRVDESYFDEFTRGTVNNISVRAVGDDTNFSFFGQEFSKTYLAAPVDVKYDGQDITWRGVSGASRYSVFINNVEVDTVSTASYRYSANDSDFTVAVKAIGDGNNTFTSLASNEEKYIYLARITSLRAEDGAVKWDAVDGASGYEVEVNGGTTYRIDKTSYDLSEGVTTRLRVRPVGSGNANYFSTWSESRSYSILNRPTLTWNKALELDGAAANSITWQAFGNADGYEVTLTLPDGTSSVSRTNNANPSFGYAYTEVGEYTVTVKSLAPANSDYCDSKPSAPIIIERLPAPTVSLNNGVTSNRTDLARGFTVHFGSISGATGYELSSEGVVVKTVNDGGVISMEVTDLLTNTGSDERNIAYSLRSIGNYKNVSGGVKITLSSLTSEAVTGRFDITVLPRPQGISISGETVTWGVVNRANGYSVYTVGSPDHADNAQWSLSAITQAGEYQLRIAAEGNGGNILPSPQSEAVNLIKLDVPTNIRANTGVDEGKLICDPVNFADGYTAYFNGGNTEGDRVENSTLVNINSYITVDSCVVVMRARGNYWSADNSVYYITSEFSQTKTFTKIAQLTTDRIRFNDRMLIWDAPGNISDTVPNIRYSILNESDIEIYNGSLRQLSLDDLAPGRHSFKFVVTGDHTQFLNSEASEVVECTILATPDVEKVGDSYTWARISSAKGYEVHIDGKLADEQKVIGQPENTYSYKPEFPEFKSKYTVEVFAVGDTGVNGNGAVITSKPCTIVQELRRVATPTIEYKYSSKADEPNNYIDSKGNFFVHEYGIIRITVKSEVEDATGYEYSVGSKRLRKDATADDALTNDFDVTTAGKYIIEVKALGGMFDDEGVYLFESSRAGGNDEYALTLLDKPNVTSVKVDYSMITWSAVGSGNSYEITIAYGNEGKTRTVTSRTASVTFEEINAVEEGQEPLNIVADEITAITIRVLGNGITTVSSESVTNYRN